MEDQLDKPIWGVRNIARVIDRTERATYYLLENGALPAKKVQGRYVSTQRVLIEALTPESVAA